MAGGSLVTTIIPVYNRSAMLRTAVDSVLAQTHRPIEIVIVDDGSTDETSAVCDELAEANEGVVRVIHQANGGPGAAREAAMRIARGEFIQFLDSDDALLPPKFAAQVAALQRDPSRDIAYGWTRIVIRGVARERPWKRTGERIETMFPSMLESRWWATPTPLYRAALLRRIGPWTSLRMEEDWEYDCRMAALGVKLVHVEVWVSESRFHDEGQLSSAERIRDPGALRDRACAHELILRHARVAGIGPEVPEMRHFARELFLLARQCGAAGLAEESRRLFELSRQASGARGNALDFRGYSLLARVLGWRRMGSIACMIDRLR